MQTLIDGYILPLIGQADPDFSGLLHAIMRVSIFYLIGALASYIYTRIMVNVSQGTLKNLRDDMFTHMEELPIRYFDTHYHGDIMSTYTNDIDTLRQMISQSMPQFLNSIITIVSVFVSMLLLNVPLTIVTLLMIGGHTVCDQKDRRTQCQILYRTAERYRNRQWLYRRNDERSESCKGLYA